jgi:periplasmic protein TonB
LRSVSLDAKAEAASLAHKKRAVLVEEGWEIQNLLLGGHMVNIISDMAWEDVVFEGRNKDYGAYRIRYDYPNHLTFSTIFVIALFLSIMIGNQLLNEKRTQVADFPRGDIIPIVKPELPPNIAIDEIKKSTGPRYALPEVTKEEVETNLQMPTYDQALDLVDNLVVDKPAFIERTNEIAVADVPPPAIDIVSIPELVPDVIKNPEFPGGMAECAKWLSRHLEYPAMAIRMGIEGKVVIEFTVDENGRISDASIIEGLHKLCDQEAIRLVKSMPAWTPGEKNGVKTTQKYALPIRFVLQ